MTTNEGPFVVRKNAMGTYTVESERRLIDAYADKDLADRICDHANDIHRDAHHSALSALASELRELVEACKVFTDHFGENVERRSIFLDGEWAMYRGILSALSAPGIRKLVEEVK